jgi:hypothetical protein
MNLSQPITITPPKFKDKNKLRKVFKPITLNSLNFTIMDNPQTKIVVAHISPCTLPLTLWSGSEYDAAGDYTQQMVENRILELLGNEPNKVLESLFLS